MNVGPPIAEPRLLRSWSFDTETDCQRWCSSTHRNDIRTLSVYQGVLQGTVVGVDPYLVSPPALGIPINAGTFIRLVLKTAQPGYVGGFTLLPKKTLIGMNANIGSFGSILSTPAWRACCRRLF